MQSRPERLSETFLEASIWISLANYISLIIATIGNILIARLLGPSFYGLSAISLFVPSLLATIAGLSMGSVLSGLVASTQSSQARRSLFSSSLLILLATSSSLSIIQVLASSFIASLLRRPEIASYLVILAPYVIGVTLLGLSQAVLNGLGLFYISAFLTLLSTLTRVSLSTMLILIGYGVSGFLLGQSLSFLVYGVAGVIITARAIGGLEIPRLSTNFVLLAKSMPLHLSNIIVIILDNFKTGFLYRVSSDFEIGNLTLASRMTTPLHQVLGALQTATLVTSSQSDNTRVLENFKSMVKYTGIVLTAIAGFLVLSVDLVVSLLFGEGFLLASRYFYLLVASTFLAPLGYHLAGSFLTARGETVTLSKLTITTALASLPITIGLTLIGGVYGFLVAQILSAGVSAMLYALVIWGRDLGIVMREGFRATTPILAGLMVGLAVELHLSSIIGDLLSVIVYSLVFTLTLPLVVDRRHIEELGLLIGRFGLIGSATASLIEVYLEIIRKLWGLELEEKTGG